MSDVQLYVNEDGEQRVSVNPDTHTIRSKKQAEAYRDMKAHEAYILSQGGFTVSDMRNLHEVYEALTTAQCGYLMMLQCFVDYDGILRKPYAKNKEMTTREMIEVLQIPDSTFYDFLRTCEDHDIIAITDYGYTMNERYHFRGSFDGPSVKSYVSKVKRVYSASKPEQVGLMYRLLPFIHLETNALCRNPFEGNPRNIDWLNQRELAEIIGVDARTLQRSLPKLRVDGQHVIARLRLDEENIKYYFNPNIIYRKSGIPEKTLLSMFAVKKKSSPAKRRHDSEKTGKKAT